MPPRAAWMNIIPSLSATSFTSLIPTNAAPREVFSMPSTTFHLSSPQISKRVFEVWVKKSSIFLEVIRGSLSLDSDISTSLNSIWLSISNLELPFSDLDIMREFAVVEEKWINKKLSYRYQKNSYHWDNLSIWHAFCGLALLI